MSSVHEQIAPEVMAQAMRPPTRLDIASALKVLLSVSFLAFLINQGHRYTSQCIARDRDFDKCWEKGLAISGTGAGGPIAGYLLGQIGKEMEKKKRFEEGYWTFNPQLRSQNNEANSPQLR